MPRAYRHQLIGSRRVRLREKQRRMTSFVGSNDELLHSMDPPKIHDGVPQPQFFSPPRSLRKVSSTGQSKIDHMTELEHPVTLHGDAS